MQALQQRVRKEVNCELVLTHSKKHDSQSDSIVEKAIQEVAGQGRTIALHTENRVPKVIYPNHPVTHWMAEYAAETMNRFRVIKQQAAPRELTRGKHEMGRVAEFGESVLWVPETWETGRVEQLEPKFENGIWLGICLRTDEAIIGIGVKTF